MKDYNGHEVLRLGQAVDPIVDGMPASYHQALERWVHALDELEKHGLVMELVIEAPGTYVTNPYLQIATDAFKHALECIHAKYGKK